MSSSPGASTTRSQTRFFGLNLEPFWRDLITAWRSMAEWPVFAWLWPKTAVRLYLPTGEQVLSLSLDAQPRRNAPHIQSARFEAILLHEDLLLRRTLDMPKLQPSELQAALALEIQTLSPFPTGDVAWTHEINPLSNTTLRVHIVLTSRKLIAQHIESTHPQLKSPHPEVWVNRVDKPGFITLAGFNDIRRQRVSTAWRWASALLALLALTLIAAMAITPSAQLYLRAIQARQAMASLQLKAGPVMAQRESLVRATEQLNNLAEITGKPVPPLQILNLITDALPDDTSLLSLQIQGAKVSISGQTPNAAALMKQLGITPGLHDVKAPTAATKPLGAPRESFTIEFTVDPTQIKLAQ